ncbi:MAG: hypothetical protein KY456_04630 [Chloroflexi bacterium]|nr:hypothetical protein [Chloroflexota bacterium]
MGDRTLAIVIWVVIDAIGAFGCAGWVAGRATRGRIPGALSGLLIGIVTLLVILGLVTVPLLRVVDLYSVGIELGIMAPPEGVSSLNESGDGLVESPQEQGTSGAGDALRTAIAQTRAFASYAVAVLTALVGAAVLGGVAGGRTQSRPGLDPATAVVSLAVVMALMAVLTVWLWPSLRATALAAVDMDQSAGPDAGVNLTEVARHPQAMWGQTVTISGLVDHVLSPRAVLLGNDKPIVGDKVLVLGEELLADLVTDKKSRDEVILKGDVAQVTGEVRPLADLEPGRIPSELAGYEGQAVVIARQINLDVPVAAANGDKEFTVGTDGPERGVTVNDVIDHTEQHLGQRVSVSAEVEEGLLTPHAFLLGDRGLLAVSAEPRPELFVEATAYVTGEVRRFGIAELEQELRIDLDDAGLRQYEGEPVIVVHAVEVVM